MASLDTHVVQRRKKLTKKNNCFAEKEERRLKEKGMISFLFSKQMGIWQVLDFRTVTTTRIKKMT